ncbi:hypothetical protein PSTG_17724 [Puccinia striiformis f. sp. tritici PST-78]|uniref:Endonuclease/exonuclease/phosphatase domain-containing protein n=5 Tax=Puccinia striiformis f. sp. tritici PST-78 TaxID=1165861 RepID=A0A0L0UPV8_9BASI|nr:hypothetical protein PSTG_17724 [Puccinia striiformis f. sp. tritici PST-78]
MGSWDGQVLRMNGLPSCECCGAEYHDGPNGCEYQVLIDSLVPRIPTLRKHVTQQRQEEKNEEVFVVNKPNKRKDIPPVPSTSNSKPVPSNVAPDPIPKKSKSTKHGIAFKYDPLKDHLAPQLNICVIGNTTTDKNLRLNMPPKFPYNVLARKRRTNPPCRQGGAMQIPLQALRNRSILIQRKRKSLAEKKSATPNSDLVATGHTRGAQSGGSSMQDRRAVSSQRPVEINSVPGESLNESRQPEHPCNTRRGDVVIEDTARYVLTNTGSLTTVQLYSALKHSLRHHPETLTGIIKVKSVLQPNRRMRFDIWVKNEVSAGLQRSLRLDFKGRKILSEEIKEKNLSWEETIMRSMLPRYRLCRWVATRDQPLTKGLVQGSTKDKAARINVLTWNINGIKSKLPALKALLDDKSVAVAAVQEHLRRICQYIPGIPGYTLFERPRETGFRGHCLYIDKSYVAHEVPTSSKHIIYVKLFGMTQDKPWHIVSVYMPSGSSRAKDRREVWHHVYNTLRPLVHGEENPHITILGDMNDGEEQILKILQ